MANTYKNIVITPNRTTEANVVPTIQFSGGDGTSNTDIYLRTYTTSNGTLSFEGSAGQLFSITNDLSNVIFSVNDISGIPSLEINANGDITMAEFGGKIGIGRKPDWAFFSAKPTGDSYLYFDSYGVGSGSNTALYLSLLQYNNGYDSTNIAIYDGFSAALVRSNGTNSLPVRAGDGGYFAYAGGYDGTAIRNTALIGSVFEANATFNYVPQALTFHTGSSGNGSERMRITANGSVLIGTNTVIRLLSGKGGGILNLYDSGPFVDDFESQLFDKSLSLVAPAHQYPAVEIRAYGGNNTTSNAAYMHGEIRILRERGTPTNPANTMIDDVIGAVIFRGYNSGLNDYSGAAIRALQTANAISTGNPVALAFDTTDGSTQYGVERMRIDANGFVGIGTTIPYAQLTQYDATAVSRVIGTSTIANQEDVAVGNVFYGPVTSHPLNLRTNNATRLTIDANGNVGIGTTSPTKYANTTTVAINGLDSGELDLMSGNVVQGYLYSYVGGIRLDTAPGAPNLTFGTADTERMRIDANGNIGIGANSINPVEWNSANTRILKIRANPNDYATIQLENSNGSGRIWVSSNAESADEKTYIWADDNAPLTIRAGREIAFSTDAGYNERMRIDSNGRVGIGTTSATSNFEIKALGFAQQKIIEGSNTVLQFSVSPGLATLGTDTEDGLGIYTYATEKMRIQPTGNVLIGRTDSTVGQDVKLDVNGGINAASILVNGAPIESGITTGKAIAMAIVFG